MDKETITYINYFAFFILYIISFYYSYNNYTEIIGLSLLFITNTSFLLYITSRLIPIIQNANLFLNTLTFSIIVGLISFFTSLLFILISILHLQQKASNTQGTPFILPKNEKQKLNNFKYYMMITFIIGISLLYLIYNNEILFNNTLFSSLFRSNNTIQIISLILSLSIYSISILQLVPTYNIMKLPKKFIL
tara:strand:+ start:8379 stop:8954 length:576 start_codon:yes stop_codon:yes gene_type:complete